MNMRAIAREARIGAAGELVVNVRNKAYREHPMSPCT
jgi:hypothetical protein